MDDFYIDEDGDICHKNGTFVLLFDSHTSGLREYVPAELLKEALIKHGYTEAERFEIPPKPLTLEEEVIMLRVKVKELEEAAFHRGISWETHELVYLRPGGSRPFVSSFSAGNGHNKEGKIPPLEAKRQAENSNHVTNLIYSFRKKENI